MRAQPAKSRIVLVQDDPYLVDTRRAILERHGYEVEVVDTVKTARERAREFKCDLVIVDAERSRDRAIELCDELKHHNPDLHVVLVTGYNIYLRTDCPDDVIGQEEGPRGFVAKIQNLLEAADRRRGPAGPRNPTS